MSNQTSVIIPCNIDGCTLPVEFEYDPGEAQTRDYPGYPDRWIVMKHDGIQYDEMADTPETSFAYMHMDFLVNKFDTDTQSRCHFVACMNWDNSYYDGVEWID